MSLETDRTITIFHWIKVKTDGIAPVRPVDVIAAKNPVSVQRRKMFSYIGVGDNDVFTRRNKNLRWSGNSALRHIPSLLRCTGSPIIVRNVVNIKTGINWARIGKNIFSGVRNETADHYGIVNRRCIRSRNRSNSINTQPAVAAAHFRAYMKGRRVVLRLSSPDLGGNIGRGRRDVYIQKPLTRRRVGYGGLSYGQALLLAECRDRLFPRPVGRYAQTDDNQRDSPNQ